MRKLAAYSNKERNKKRDRFRKRKTPNTYQEAGIMKTLKKTLALLLAAVLTAAAVTGCSSSSSGTDSSASTAGSESSEFDASTDKYLKDGVFTVGTNAAFPPFEYIGDDGNPDGFDVALIKEVGKKLGVDVEVQDMEFDTLVSVIGTKIDGAIAGMTINDERKEKVNFSDPYFDAIQFVLVPKDPDIKTTDDFTGKKIGTQKGTTGDYLVQDMDGVEDVQYDKGIQAVQDLVAGRLDAVILDKNPVETFAAQYPDDLKALDGADFNFDTESYGIALPKDDQPLTDAVNKAIKDLKDDGTYQKLIDQYFNN